MGAAVAGAAATGPAGDWAGGRSSTQARATMITPNNTGMPTAPSGKRRRGAATLTSNNGGDAWRCRSFSDFFSASRMNDMSGPRRVAEEGGGGVVERRVQRHLGLHAGDAVDREPVLALEILDQRDQR